MSVVKATLIFSIATYLDVILNPLMCFITDSFYRTKLGRKFGRRRFFILTGIPLMLSSVKTVCNKTHQRIKNYIKICCN